MSMENDTLLTVPLRSLEGDGRDSEGVNKSGEDTAMLRNSCQSSVVDIDTHTGSDDEDNHSNNDDVLPVEHMTKAPSTCASRASMTSVYLDVCRICQMELESGPPIISPCACAGSLKYCHQECLQKWIKSADIKACELCTSEFEITTKIKPLREWKKLEMTTAERRKMMCSVTFHVIAITCVIWSLYVLIDRTTEELRTGELKWPFWTKLIVVAIGFTGGLVFMYVQCKMYVQLCRRWRSFNRVIYIEPAPDKKSIPPDMPLQVKSLKTDV